MAYERVIPIVDITARLLSNALSHNQSAAARAGQGRRAAGEPGHPGHAGQGRHQEIPGRIPVRPPCDRNPPLPVEAHPARAGADLAPQKAGAALCRGVA
ncbi:hypothetical protein G6F31_017951 [Rhizopus arrhizus]|nr:hypothetical protein G6F31_017951 [Rhizopus arrhizus]